MLPPTAVMLALVAAGWWLGETDFLVAAVSVFLGGYLAWSAGLRVRSCRGLDAAGGNDVGTRSLPVSGADGELPARETP